MLVLSRRRGEAIYIGRHVKVTVLSVRNRQVKLGIEAPAGIPIWRDELCGDDSRPPQSKNERIHQEEEIFDESSGGQGELVGASRHGDPRGHRG